VTKGGGKENSTCGKEQQSFDDLKHRLCSNLVLSFPNLQPFDIETNSFDYVVGIVLTHHGHLAEYHSETLSDTI
jgi:hypothetical protein